VKYSTALRLFALLLALVTLIACGRKLATYDYPSPVETKTREVRLLDIERFDAADGVTAYADFPGARLAGFGESGRDTFRCDIPAENQPINSSPWYAFALTAERPREIVLDLTYPVGTGNRYQPKTATSLQGPWTHLSYDRVDTIANHAYFRVPVGPMRTYLAGQEVIATDSIGRWMGNLTSTPAPRILTLGKSKLNRPIWAIELGGGKADKRPTVVFLSRQHPPEVTGWQAFQAFFERVLANDPKAQRFRETHRIIAVPVVNPDGVDEGHWRHNAGGIDLNRDWSEYRQPEVATVVAWLQDNVEKENMLWGMDFHSTQYDVLYTHDPTLVEFRGKAIVDQWTQGLAAWAAETYPGASAKPVTTAFERPVITGQDTLRVEPDAIGRPTSASWFVQHFGGVGITYEVSDEQDRDYIRAKARKAAELMMEMLTGKSAAGQ